jgi:hypothetical protein
MRWRSHACAANPWHVEALPLSHSYTKGVAVNGELGKLTSPSPHLAVHEPESWTGTV